MSQLFVTFRFSFSFILVEGVIDGAQHSILVHGVSISFVKPGRGDDRGLVRGGLSEMVVNPLDTINRVGN